MTKPTPVDMRISLEDARFFYEKLDPIIRGSEQQQDLELIRRYFRAYLYCWKSVLHFVREAKGLSGKRNDEAWIAWCKKRCSDRNRMTLRYLTASAKPGITIRMWE